MCILQMLHPSPPPHTWIQLWSKCTTRMLNVRIRSGITSSKIPDLVSVSKASWKARVITRIFKFLLLTTLLLASSKISCYFSVQQSSVCLVITPLTDLTESSKQQKKQMKHFILTSSQVSCFLSICYLWRLREVLWAPWKTVCNIRQCQKKPTQLRKTSTYNNFTDKFLFFFLATQSKKSQPSKWWCNWA